MTHIVFLLQSIFNFSIYSSGSSNPHIDIRINDSSNPHVLDALNSLTPLFKDGDDTSNDLLAPITPSNRSRLMPKWDISTLVDATIFGWSTCALLRKNSFTSSPSFSIC
jgi:hypothetical protein